MWNLGSIINAGIRRDVESIARHEAKRRRDIHAKRLKRATEKAEREHEARLLAMQREAEARIAERKARQVIVRQDGRGVIRPIKGGGR